MYMKRLVKYVGFVAKSFQEKGFESALKIFHKDGIFYIAMEREKRKTISVSLP